MEEQAAHSGFTHKFTVEHTDLSGTAATTLTVDLLTDLPIGTLVDKAALYLETGFVGASVTNLLCEVGWDSAADDPDGLLAGYEIATAGTEILAGDGDGAAFAASRTGYAFVASGKLTALFTATGANLTALTSGKVHILLGVRNMAALCR